MAPKSLQPCKYRAGNGSKIAMCKKHTAIAHMIQAGLNKLPYGLSNIEKYMEIAGQNELNKLDSKLSLLAAIAGVAPMLGFLGTVMGMIKAFFHGSNHYNSNTTIISRGYLRGYDYNCCGAGCRYFSRHRL